MISEGNSLVLLRSVRTECHSRQLTARVVRHNPIHSKVLPEWVISVGGF